RLDDDDGVPIPFDVERGDGGLSSPKDPDPPDGATGISAQTSLRWDGPTGATYDIYLEAGSLNPDELIASDVSETSVTPELERGVTYYWKVVAKDAAGQTATSRVWSFTTSSSTTDRPATPTLTGPVQGVTNVPYTFEAVTTDPNGDEVTYEFDWGDDTTTEHPRVGTVESGVEVSSNKVWSEPGTYRVRVRATDTSGLTSDWSPGMSVTIDEAEISDDNYAGTKLGDSFDVVGTEKGPTYSWSNYEIESLAWVSDADPPYSYVNISKNGELVAEWKKLEEGHISTVSTDLTLLPLSISVASRGENTRHVSEFYLVMTKTTPDIISAEPSNLRVGQGGTSAVTITLPSDLDVCLEDVIIFGSARHWIPDDQEWVGSGGLDSAFGGRAVRTRGECPELETGPVEIEVEVPEDTSAGSYGLDVFFAASLNDDAYRIKGITVDVQETNDPPNRPHEPSPPDGSTGANVDSSLSWSSGDPDDDDVTY
ncbi:MAG: PKD domain-containing protein, partial [Halobacteriales archaeon]|nr:PKD domain-containing protein [Halobacteriales archaeon]